jgi:hypothetical protein
MGFRIIFKNLLEIKLLHHYFLDKGIVRYDTMSPEEKDKLEEKYDIRNILDITPTGDSMNLLSAHRCVYKSTPMGILVGIKAEPDDLLPGIFNPFISMEDDLSLRFILRLKDAGFANYTALPLKGNSGSMFIFKNYSGPASTAHPSLSAIPPVYKPGEEYLPGDMLSDHESNQTRLFTARIKTSNDTSNVSDWISEEGDETTPLRYANVNDRYPVVTGIMNYEMKMKEAYPTAIFKNHSGETVKPKVEVIPGDFNILQADLRAFPEGFYSLHVECADPVYQDDVSFYLLQHSDVPFGLIDIKVKSDLPGYDLFDQGHLRSPAFELRFRNRRTHWRYFGKIFNIPFEVQDPLPLTRYGQIEITKPPEPEDIKTIMLPNPSDPVIKPEALISSSEKKYYSDIHIN